MLLINHHSLVVFWCGVVEGRVDLVTVVFEMSLDLGQNVLLKGIKGTG